MKKVVDLAIETVCQHCSDCDKLVEYALKKLKGKKSTKRWTCSAIPIAGCFGPISKEFTGVEFTLESIKFRFMMKTLAVELEAREEGWRSLQLMTRDQLLKLVQVDNCCTMSDGMKLHVVDLIAKVILKGETLTAIANEMEEHFGSS